jgi:hypothetical protein
VCDPPRAPPRDRHPLPAPQAAEEALLIAREELAELRSSSAALQEALWDAQAAAPRPVSLISLFRPSSHLRSSRLQDAAACRELVLAKELAQVEARGEARARQLAAFAQEQAAVLAQLEAWRAGVRDEQSQALEGLSAEKDDVERQRIAAQALADRVQAEADARARELEEAQEQARKLDADFERRVHDEVGAPPLAPPPGTSIHQPSIFTCVSTCRSTRAPSGGCTRSSRSASPSSSSPSAARASAPAPAEGVARWRARRPRRRRAAACRGCAAAAAAAVRWS